MKKKLPDPVVGQIYGRWTVLEQTAIRAHGDSRWLVRCACGAERTVLGNSLKRGTSSSCGCRRSEVSRERMTGVRRNVTHGMSGTRIYAVWTAMKQRCTNPDNPNYPRYGGRGISVCDEWLNSFETFYKDMGDPPEGLTLDRIDNNGNYEPDNCRWATRSTQQYNRETVHCRCCPNFLGRIYRAEPGTA